MCKRDGGNGAGRDWLPWPVPGCEQWSRVRFRERRGVIWEDRRTRLAVENVPARRAFLERLWPVGVAQSELVSLMAEDVNWPNQTLSELCLKCETGV